ncbi:hypothetical protein O181_097897 [Austropuccinia psidii MF-1]|uniref:Uncharacterized protein n=1 Tax=Austropuccinia psidii MF-1 TaxID=1389203 RepID=A0A9Q3JA55_9BASI|nr:hypothetical protein [Austropuccinia psidii MF-1]
MVRFVHEMTSAPLPDHLTPLPCLILHMNWVLHHPRIISSSSQDILPLLPPHLHNHPHLILSTSYHDYSSAAPSRYDSDGTTPSPASPLPHLLCTLPCSRSP